MSVYDAQTMWFRWPSSLRGTKIPTGEYSKLVATVFAACWYGVYCRTCGYESYH